MATVWLYGRTGEEPALADALGRRGLAVAVHRGEVAELLRRTYDGQGLVFLDVAEPGLAALLQSPLGRSMPLVVRCAPEGPAVDGLALDGNLDLDTQAHHLADVLRDAGNLRRHPRVPVRREMRLAGLRVFTRDVSLYGVRLEGNPALPVGDFAAELEGGPGEPVIRLVVREVSRHADSVALRCRPERDLDLVVWLDLLLAALASSPLHRDVDPFGPLFAAD